MCFLFITDKPVVGSSQKESSIFNKFNPPYLLILICYVG